MIDGIGKYISEGFYESRAGRQFLGGTSHTATLQIIKGLLT